MTLNQSQTDRHMLISSPDKGNCEPWITKIYIWKCCEICPMIVWSLNINYFSGGVAEVDLEIEGKLTTPGLMSEYWSFQTLHRIVQYTCQFHAHFVGVVEEVVSMTTREFLFWCIVTWDFTLHLTISLACISYEILFWIPHILIIM